jgi:predicted phage terminase large subunit-like protein
VQTPVRETLAAKYKAKRVLVEDTGAGTALVQELRGGKVPGIVAVKPERDKVSRMAVVSAKFESGQVFLPKRVPWLVEFEGELSRFLAPGMTINAIQSARPYQSRITYFR